MTWTLWKETIEALRALANIVCMPLVLIGLYIEWRKWDRRPTARVADLTVSRLFYIVFLFFIFTWMLL